MREIGAFEAKNRFSALLADVMAGQEITITHRGKPVALLMPVTRAHDPDAIAVTAERFRALRARAGGKFDWDEWKQYRDEGRP